MAHLSRILNYQCSKWTAVEFFSAQKMGQKMGPWSWVVFDWDPQDPLKNSSHRAVKRYVLVSYVVARVAARGYRCLGWKPQTTLFFGVLCGFCLHCRSIKDVFYVSFNTTNGTVWCNFDTLDILGLHSDWGLCLIHKTVPGGAPPFILGI